MQLTPETLQALTSLIRQWTGLTLSSDKDYLVRHRLGPVVRSCGFDSYEQLLLRLQAAGATQLRQAVIEAITTKETSFFRDAWLFDALQQHVLPQLVSELPAARRRIRILSAGASTGQEAYSLAMIVREFVEQRPRDCGMGDFSITGVDISGEAVDAARTGLYTQAEIARGLAEPRLRRHVRREGTGWAMADELRQLVQFRTHNLLQPLTEPGPFDLILCRNVLIYFDDATRGQVCQSLRGVLRPAGWLAVGAAESLVGVDVGLETVRFGRAFLYRNPASPS